LATVSEDVHDVAEQQSDVFEAAMVAADADRARLALRNYLFGQARMAVEGSVADAVAALSSAPSGQSSAAAIVLRATTNRDVIHENGPNQLDRHVVALVEGAMPGFCAFLGVKPKSQTYEKFEVLRGAHGVVLEKLEPLRTAYTSVDSLLLAKPRLLGALNHGQVKAYCRPFHLAEVGDAVESLLGKIARVQRMETSLGDDVEACRREIAAAFELASTHPTFVTLDHLTPFLDNVGRALDALLITLRGRLSAEIVRSGDGGSELQKRYPLHEEGRELRVVVPLRNDGPGSATDVTVRISSSSDSVAVANAAIYLGTVAPGEFSMTIEALVVCPCTQFDAYVYVEWGEVGTARRKEDLFDIRVLAQRADIDWAKYRFWNPYSTEPAEGTGFYGRDEQVQTLMSRLLQTPMEPSYITGQKRAGKTSLAKMAVEEARRVDPRGKLEPCYISWGHIAHDDPRRALMQLGEAVERFILASLPGGAAYPQGDYSGSLSPLFQLSAYARQVDPERRFVIILDEFDELPQDLYLRGNLAETFFANIRALTTTPNICLILVGGENMPFIMERQGQRLNKFNRVNLTYFSRATEWEDFTRLVKGPSEGVLTWHTDAISEVFNLTNGSPYFSNIICKNVAARARTERDGDISAEEVRRAVQASISGLDTNAFIHLWEDGTRSPVEERETVILKRRRTLAALARCLRAHEPATQENIHAHRSASPLSVREFASLLHNFVDREVLVERDGGFEPMLPIFRLWLVDVGLNRLANDGISEELASIEQRLEDEAHVRSEEIVELTERWQPYRGKRLGADDVRAWLSQRPSNREQRLLFTILRSVRVVGLEEIFTRLRSAGNIIRTRLGVPTRRSLADRRGDVVVTYVDGEGKSGQRYAGDYADENKISQEAILPLSSFRDSYRSFLKKNEPPKAIVIIDDIVATGGSLSANVDAFIKKHADLLAETHPFVQVYALFSTKRGRERVLATLAALDYNEIDFGTGELLDSSAFAFAAASSAVWTSSTASKRWRWTSGRRSIASNLWASATKLC
jgi:hypothetical protein